MGTDYPPVSGDEVDLTESYQPWRSLENIGLGPDGEPNTVRPKEGIALGL